MSVKYDKTNPYTKDLDNLRSVIRWLMINKPSMYSIQQVECITCKKTRWGINITIEI